MSCDVTQKVAEGKQSLKIALKGAPAVSMSATRSGVLCLESWEYGGGMETRRIVLATRNAGKVRELTNLLAESGAGHGMEVLGLDSFPESGNIEETGATFEENALLKARYVAQTTGLPSLADDSGLVVNCLDGAPGIYSVRYADDWNRLPGESRDIRNIRKLLHTLEGVPPAERACRFVSCIAAVKPDGARMLVTGVWEGLVLDGMRGANGFGYDPIFFDPTCGKSAAELRAEEKNARSHRGKALRELFARWAEFMRPQRAGHFCHTPLTPPSL